MKCFYCEVDVMEFPVMYGVNRRYLVGRHIFWEEIGKMCEDCFKKGELGSLPILKEVV